jgi:hypothetical protein
MESRAPGSPEGRNDKDLNDPAFIEANDQLCTLVPELRAWQAEDRARLENEVIFAGGDSQGEWSRVSGTT